MDMIHWGSLDISIVDTAVYDNPILAYKWFYSISETTNYKVWIIKGVKMIRVDLKKSTKARKAHSRLEIQNLIFEIRLFASLSDFARHVSILHRYVLTPIALAPIM